MRTYNVLGYNVNPLITNENELLDRTPSFLYGELSAYNGIGYNEKSLLT